jgi:DNA-binding transcriptional MerR regulator
MTTAGKSRLSIGEVSARTGLSTHTLRFYEQEGLFVEPVRRNAAGRREFSDQEVGWLQVCTKLRSSGMSLPDIRRYAQLVREGPGNEAERFEILQRHERKVTQQMADLQEALDTIKAKVTLYAAHLASGSADALWRDGPTCSSVDG